MWNDEDRQRYDRRGLRYPSDLTDAEWALIEPLIPPAKRGGRRRSVDLREVVQGLLYVLETGCQWRHLPTDFPPRSTVWEYFVELRRHARAHPRDPLSGAACGGGPRGEPERSDHRQPERQVR